MLAAPAQVSAADEQLRCGVRGFQQGRHSGSRRVLGLGGPPASLRSASPRPPPSAPRSGPLPREDGCRTPGPQLLPMPGALLRPRTLLSPAAADGRSRHRTPSAPPRGGGAEGAPRAPRPRPAGQPAWAVEARVVQVERQKKLQKLTKQVPWSYCVLAQAEAEEDCRSEAVREGDDDDENESPAETDLQAQLQRFRAQWMFELAPGGGSGNLESRPCRAARGSLLRAGDTRGKQELAKEEKARELFLKAVEEEQNGALYEAIKFYRRAMQLVPDIEFKITYTRSPDGDGVGNSYIEDTDDDSKMADLLSYFQQQLTFQESVLKLCQPELESSQTHISALPMEVLMYVFRWVVSSDLDLRSLEQLSQVCRGFYICARDPEIWRLACLKVWGRSCIKLVPYTSWREMFLERPRVRFDGVYISKTTYIRQGEQSLDGFYRAWHQVEYYRYVRFFPDGHVMMLTTPEEPPSIVPRLRTRNTRTDAILLGHYRLSQDTDNQTKVFAVITKKKEEKALDHKYRYFRRAPVQEADQNFHVGLQLCSSGHQSFNKLIWIHHSCHITYKSTGETAVTAFEIDKMYTPLLFARVRSYTAFSERPL